VYSHILSISAVLNECILCSGLASSKTEWKLHGVYEIAGLLEHFDEESVRKRALNAYIQDDPINKITRAWVLCEEVEDFHLQF
jgi:hypothetical protein